jgi:hypothetical protein
VDAAEQHDIKLELDRRIQEQIRQEILQTYPGHGFLGEEGGELAREGQYEWVVDPIDGTVNLFYGIPHYAVSVACRLDGRTLAGADANASQWKYVPVRRLAYFLEESLFRGLHWVVFEPNDEPLWAQMRLNVGAFMNNLFKQGAFQGTSPREAYLVKCDRETTTQNDINLGIVNILVGFAPLKPAEFVYIKIQQLAGQIQS